VWVVRHWETIAIVLTAYVLSGIPLGLALSAYLRLRRPAARTDESGTAEASASPVTGR
jgi:hypothetical protein